MAHPTPRADALRQMREAKFEAEQKRLKQETGKPEAAPKRKADAPVVAEGDEKPAARPAEKKTAEKAEAPAELALEGAADAPAAEGDSKPAAKAARKSAPKKAAAKKAKAAK